MARIAVVGSGAVGLFYGAQFILAGHDVRFLLRRDHQRISADGLVILTSPTPEIASARAGATLRIPPTAFRACRDSEECARGGAPDWILVALKTTAIADIGPLLTPLLTPSASVVGMCNGLGIEERLAAHFDADGVFGAMAHVCLRRGDDGTIHHQAHGKLLLGHLRDDPRRLDRLVDLIDGAGIAYDRCGCLLEARWRKLVWNFPYNGLSVVLDRDGAATDEIMATAERRALVDALMREVVSAANADLASRGTRCVIDADAWVREMQIRTETMGAYLTSTLLDMRAGAALEVEALFGEPVRRAHACGIAVPRMEMLLELVRQRSATSGPTTR